MAQVVESLNVADQASIVSADTASSISTYQVMYDNAHMISELEARVMILFWAHSNCLEVICRVLGVKEDTVRIYIDYRSLYASVVAAADLTRLKKNRKAYAIEYILARLALIQDSDDDHMWMLTLKAPKERKPSISSPEGHLLPADLSSTGVSEAANKILAEEASSKEKEKKRLEHQDELLKFIREKPADISSFDYDLYQKLKK